MRLAFPIASKSYICNHCAEPIDHFELYANIKLGSGKKFASDRQLQTAHYLTIRLHLDCIGNWARLRPRRPRQYKGRTPLSIVKMEHTPDGRYAFERIETLLTPEQKKRRAVLITLYHLYKKDRDVGYIVAELETIGGVPWRWLS